MSAEGGRGGLDLEAYLDRIGVTGRPDLPTLHRAHVTAIPFENLDPRRGLPVSLSLPDLERKLVAGRRGGYCFEHNLLFAAALRELGMRADPMLARVGPRESAGRPLSHLFLRVHTEEAVWHADVGFGSGTLLEPIPFGPGEVIVQDGWRRRVVADGGGELILQEARGEDWSDVYGFAPVPAHAIDIEMSNWFTSTHPGSRFVGGLVLTRNHEDGSRTVLSDWSGTLRLIEQAPSGETAREVERTAIPSLLQERFGLPGWTLDGRDVPVPAAEEP